MGKTSQRNERVDIGQNGINLETLVGPFHRQGASRSSWCGQRSGRDLFAGGAAGPKSDR